MRLSRRILGNDTVRDFLCRLGAWYIRLVHATGRWEVVGDDIPRSFWDAGEAFILCFWHGRLLMMPYCRPRSVPIHMLISQHRDGQIIARTVSHFGIETIAGSSNRGGASALRAILRTLSAGGCIGITPDGPRGPRRRASDGVVNIARLSGAAIVPATYSVDRCRALGTWDRFLVALPFSRGVIVWGEPIRVARDLSPQQVEDARLRVEQSLNAITAAADRRMGRGRGLAEGLQAEAP